MKKIISLVCALVLLALCVAPMPAKAAANDTLELSSVFLRTAEGKEGIFFGAYFNLSQDTLDDMSRYGLALTTKNLADDDTWTDEMDKSVLRSRYETGLKAGVRKEVTSTSLVNIINISNDSMTNNRNANTVIYVRPYVEMQGGSFVYGDASSITMKQVAQMVDVAYSDLTDTQKRGLLGMYERFNSCMKGWGLTSVKANYPNGTDVNGESLILQYRRDKVVANMTAQNNVLWSITTEDNQPVQYSRMPTSFGLDLETKYDAANVYTLYPGRIYRGIPYTHGSAGLDAFQALAGDPDANGVYTFDDFHASYFNGGSYSNLGTKSKTWKDSKGNVLETVTNLDVTSYNFARLGNDCWDAVYWAWASAGANTTADQTQQMTVSYGLNLVGEDILTEAMQGFTAPDGRVMGENGGTIWDFICNKSTSTGYYAYRSIDNAVTGAPLSYTGYYTKTNSSDWLGLSSGEYTINLDYTGSIDGTTLVRYATQKFTGELYTIATTKTDLEDLRPVCDYQAMYQTYALAKPGDAMVHFENTQGHAIMVIDTNIVFTNKVLNADGTVNLAESTIDGDASTITLLEQASGHESRQSRDTWGAYDQTTHSSDHSKFVEDCKYCAGYIEEEGIWALDYGLQVRSFKTMAESDYLAVTHEVLTNPAAKISASRISDSGSDVDVSGIYTGTLSSTYRVAYITLDIFDNAGDNVNSATCFSVQSTVRDPFSLGLFPIDGGNKAAYGNVLKGTLALQQKTNGTKTWLEAPDLEPGSYSYALTCVLANGYTNTFRTGYFTVSEGTNPAGDPAYMVYAE